MNKRLFGVLLTVVVALLMLSGCERPESKQGRANLLSPGADFVADVKRGKSLFDANCARCHGQNGRGTSAGPALVHSVYRPGHHADLAFYFAVRDGVRQHHWNFGNMQPIDALMPEDVGHIIAYVRAAQRAVDIK